MQQSLTSKCCCKGFARYYDLAKAVTHCSSCHSEASVRQGGEVLTQLARCMEQALRAKLREISDGDDRNLLRKLDVAAHPDVITPGVSKAACMGTFVRDAVMPVLRFHEVHNRDPRLYQLLVDMLEDIPE